MARPLARDANAVSTLVALIALLIAIGLALAAFYALLPRPGPSTLRAQEGDDVTVDYIGTFQDTGLVFDTSEKSVALDNATWQKAYSFPWRSSWTTLAFKIGEGKVVRGFDLGVQSMALGDSKTIVVPADQGYGPADPNKITIKPILESVPAMETMNSTVFSSKYKTNAVSGETVTDPFWGWTAVVSVAGDIVTVTSNPVPGEIVRPYGAWNARVTCVDDAGSGCAGQILVRHVLDSTSVDRIGAKLTDGREFYISSVDLGAGTYTLNFNRQVVGRTLVFQVTMVSIARL